MERHYLRYQYLLLVQYVFVHPLSPDQVILTIIISYIVDTFVSQYRLSEKLRETLKRNHEEKQPEEGLIAFCTKQTQSGLWVGAHSLHATWHQLN